MIPYFLIKKYSALTCNKNKHGDVSLIMIKNCRTLVPIDQYIYVADNRKLLYQGAVQNDIKNRNSSNEYVQVWGNC